MSPLIQVVAVPFVVGEVGEERCPGSVLPPSFGIMLMRTPPACVSAESPLVVYWISWIIPSFQYMPAVLARAFQVVEADAVDLLHGVRVAVEGQRRLLHAAGAADVHAVGARRLRPASPVPGIRMPTAWMLRPVGTASRTSRDMTVCVVTLCTSTIGEAPGDGDGFLDGADGHLDVHRGGEAGRQLDALADDRAEAGQRERHLVGARPQVRDLIAALAVADRGPGPFDEGRTARFDGHAGEDRCPSCR